MTRQSEALVNGTDATGIGQIYTGPRVAAGVREVHRDMTVQDGTRVGVDGISGSAGIITIQTPVGMTGDTQQAYVTLHVLETSPHRSLAYLPIWDEGADELDGECSQCVCQTACHEFRSAAIAREILEIGSPRDWAGHRAEVPLQGLVRHQGGRGHPDMPDLKAHVLARDFNADYPTRTRPESRRMARELIDRYSIVERSAFRQGTMAGLDADEEDGRMTEWQQERFAISTQGMRELHVARPPWMLVKELIQNAWDEAPEATVCRVRVKPEVRPGVAQVVVEDDGPGFADIADAFTLMKPTPKRMDPTRRGRFNIGEKEVVSVALEAEIRTVGWTVTFPPSGGREVKPNRRQRGTVVTALLPWDAGQSEQLAEMLRRFRPTDCRLVVNGQEVPKREPVSTRQARLPTVLQSEPGGPLRPTRRVASIDVLEPVADTGLALRAGHTHPGDRLDLRRRRRPEGASSPQQGHGRTGLPAGHLRRDAQRVLHRAAG